MSKELIDEFTAYLYKTFDGDVGLDLESWKELGEKFLESKRFRTVKFTTEMVIEETREVEYKQHEVTMFTHLAVEFAMACRSGKICSQITLNVSHAESVFTRREMEYILSLAPVKHEDTPF